MQIDISPIAAFRDNYFWCACRPGSAEAVVVDPGAAEPVIRYLDIHHLTLHTILITHRHPDHVGGVVELLRRYPEIPVYGPKSETIPKVTHSLQGGDYVELDVLGLSFEVIDVPGHTEGHIAYYCKDYNPPILFCGDTLFSVGCGRLLGGTAQQLHNSLQKLAALPSQTRVYCAHEYTLSNIRFAKQVEPDNTALSDYERHIIKLREQQIPSVPSTLALELAVNPFLRVTQESVKQRVEIYRSVRTGTPADVFTELRRWKDTF